MAFTLTMPEVGETVTEGTIERWLKQPGEQVSKYDPIVEVNTDKVNVELPCPVNGKLLEILAKEGETVAIGAPLCTIETVAGDQPAETAPPAQRSPNRHRRPSRRERRRLRLRASTQKRWRGQASARRSRSGWRHPRSARPTPGWPSRRT